MKGGRNKLQNTPRLGEWVEEYFSKKKEEEEREEVRKKALIEENKARYLPILEKITRDFELREKAEVISEELGGEGLVTKRLVTNDKAHVNNLQIVYQAQGKKRMGRNTKGEFVVPKGHSTSYGPYGESTSGPPCYYRPGPREELVDEIELRSSLVYPYEYSDSDWGGMVVKHEFEAGRDIRIKWDCRLWSREKNDLYHNVHLFREWQLGQGREFIENEILEYLDEIKQEGRYGTFLK